MTFLSRLDVAKYLPSGLQSHDQMIRVCTAVSLPVWACRENRASAWVRQRKWLDRGRTNANSDPKTQHVIQNETRIWIPRCSATEKPGQSDGCSRKQEIDSRAGLLWQSVFALQNAAAYLPTKSFQTSDWFFPQRASLYAAGSCFSTFPQRCCLAQNSRPIAVASTHLNARYNACCNGVGAWQVVLLLDVLAGSA